MQVVFPSLIGGAKCVNGDTAPPPKSLVRTLNLYMVQIITFSKTLIIPLHVFPKHPSFKTACRHKHFI